MKKSKKTALTAAIFAATISLASCGTDDSGMSTVYGPPPEDYVTDEEVTEPDTEEITESETESEVTEPDTEELTEPQTEEVTETVTNIEEDTTEPDTDYNPQREKMVTVYGPPADYEDQTEPNTEEETTEETQLIPLEELTFVGKGSEGIFFCEYYNDDSVCINGVVDGSEDTVVYIPEKLSGRLVRSVNLSEYYYGYPDLFSPYVKEIYVTPETVLLKSSDNEVVTFEEASQTLAQYGVTLNLYDGSEYNPEHETFAAVYGPPADY